MKPRRKLLTPILLGLVLLVVVLMVVAAQRTGSQFVPPPLPSPNGFDELQRAAQLLAPRTSFYAEMDEAELKRIVTTNQEALRIVRVALRESMAVPVDWTIDPSTGVGVQTRLNAVQNIRSLGRALAAEARLQRNEDPEGAQKTLLEAFELGTTAVQGGLMIDYQFGLAIQLMAVEELKRLVDVHPEIGSTVMRELLELRQNVESAREVTDRERAYIESATTGISGWLMRRNLDALIGSAVEATHAAETRSMAQQSLFIAHLAIRDYQRQYANWPSTLEDVRAGILSNLPIDPYSNQPLLYRVTDDGYQLYSVGENQVDDEGVGDETGLGLDFVYDLTPSEE